MQSRFGTDKHNQYCHDSLWYGPKGSKWEIGFMHNFTCFACYGQSKKSQELLAHAVMVLELLGNATHIAHVSSATPSAVDF